MGEATSDLCCFPACTAAERHVCGASAVFLKEPVSDAGLGPIFGEAGGFGFVKYADTHCSTYNKTNMVSLECRGCVQGDYPIYLPDSVLFTAKMVQHAHVTTLHGGVCLTMMKVREKFWVPRLRKLVKKTVKNCSGCKRFQAVALKNPPTAPLPSERTEGTTAFNVISVEFAGSVKYHSKRKEERKAYVILYSCSLTRGVFLELLPSLETTDFIQSLKRFIARRGRPSKVCSDNGKTFVAATKWVKKVRRDERFHSFLSEHSIQWQFNLSLAPWWGGQFERLIGLMKSMFYKTVGQGLLTWEELSEVILDIEVAMNNRPLCYVEDDVQLLTLTPNVFLMLNSSVLPELHPYHIEERDLRKCAKFLMKMKDVMWCRWTTEYLSALREHHRLRCGKKGKENSLAVGDVVIVKSHERNRNCWPLRIVEQLIAGRGGVVRGAKIWVGRSHVECPVQLLYPLELSCDEDDNQETALTLNPDAPMFRPRHDAAAVAELQVKSLKSACQ
ncbi:uncharacterized protein [Montipora foliosa]|uniref:uncharacterized protein n=1 Tax=Montipora foliosa TaxID=591990 RepID=UPI0035F0FBF3